MSTVSRTALRSNQTCLVRLSFADRERVESSGRSRGAAEGRSRNSGGGGQARSAGIVVGLDESSAPPEIRKWRYHFETGTLQSFRAKGEEEAALTDAFAGLWAGVIKGEVYNYPGHDDAAPISTSQVARAHGYTVRPLPKTLSLSLMFQSCV